MSNSLFMQLGMIAVAAAIFYLYVSPTVAAIRVDQDAVVQYQAEFDKVQSVNAQLASDVATVQAVALDDKTRLERYLATSLDEVEVMKELVKLLSSQNLTPTSLAYTGPSEVIRVATMSPSFGLIPHEFTFGVELSYDKIKALLAAIESSDYQLEISALAVTPVDTKIVTAEFTLVRYVLVPVDAPPPEEASSDLII